MPKVVTRKDIKNSVGTKVDYIKNATIYCAYLLVIWGFYRFLFELPSEIEELVIKPVVWLLPVLYFVYNKEKLNIASLGFTLKNLFPSVYMAIGLGAVFVMEGVLTNFLKYGGLHFGANIGNLPLMTSLGLSFATAFTEETAFRGYVFTRIWSATKNEWSANLITSGLWTLIHVPIAFFVWKLNLAAALTYLMLTAIYGIGAAFVFGKTRNILSPILLHVLWEWPIILFR